MKNLGFGMMRLPVLSGPNVFDFAKLYKMVYEFLDALYTYFDTSYVYHNGKSEEATRKALVERHPRESYTVATKFPTFMLIPEDRIEETFQSQLDNLGVDYIDYYLLHNIQTVYYDGYDGNGGIVKTKEVEGRRKNPSSGHFIPFFRETAGSCPFRASGDRIRTDRFKSHRLGQ